MKRLPERKEKGRVLLAEENQQASHIHEWKSVRTLIPEKWMLLLFPVFFRRGVQIFTGQFPIKLSAGFEDSFF